MRLNSKQLFTISLTMLIVFVVYIEKTLATSFDQSQFPYAQLHIQLMPEFDYPNEWETEKPSLLLGYYGSLINKTGTEYSGEIQIKLPINEPNFKIELVAEFPGEGQSEVELVYEIDEQTGIISWIPTKPIASEAIYDFVIEYYYSPFEINGHTKSFSYSFTGEAEIEEVNFIVYAPLGSEEFTATSDTEPVHETSYGIDLYQFPSQPLKSGEIKEINVTYNKEGRTSTIELMNKEGAPNDSVHASVSGNNEAPPLPNLDSRSMDLVTSIIIIGISLLIMVGFIFFGLKGRK